MGLIDTKSRALSTLHVAGGLMLTGLVVAARLHLLHRCATLGCAIADRTRPFERPVDQARCRVLVAGDSTGVGTGADVAEHSLAGRIAADFPDVAIVNRARNGAKTLDTLRQLQAERGPPFDVVLVHTGGNDVLRRTPLRSLEGHVDALLEAACARGRHVLVTTTPNVGLAPMFFAPLSWWLTRRSRQVRDLFALASARHGAHYADFFHPRTSDPFSREWRRFFAADRLHPSSECYGFVYAALLRATPLAQWLGATSGASDRRAHVDEFGEEDDVQCLAQEADAR